jgi:hypothetical protein
MEYLKKVKIKKSDYKEKPVTVECYIPKSLKTLKNIKKYDVHPVFKKILEHPYMDVYDIDPSFLIIKSEDKIETEFTISILKNEVIDNFEKFEINENGKVNKIEISKDFIKNQIKKLKKKEKELEIEFGKKNIKVPDIKR